MTLIAVTHGSYHSCRSKYSSQFNRLKPILGIKKDHVLIMV
nr:MAG TPA: hypothetical protein [Caudoviricetes sp.]DAK30095.1 MAG TPA: hypothetical protein [Caudoviricetes sp.]DAY68018.1 MAG TPA: hypothetical protein [Caudoviricetes sp.]